jgi:quinolinate synthase
MSVTAANRLDPDVTFLCHCNPCPHMKRMTLPGIRHAPETMTPEILIDPALAARARAAVERMIAIA